VRILEITINARQVIALVWTMIAIAVSLVVVAGMGWPFSINSYYYYGMPWWLLVAAFFGILLVITLPVYLLIALWGITSKSEA
jgi:hypothetical protein